VELMDANGLDVNWRLFTPDEFSVYAEGLEEGRWSALAADPEPAPAKSRKPPRKYRPLEPPLSPTGNRIFVAAHLEYTLEFPWCERIIRDRLRDVPGVDDLPRPKEQDKSDYNSVRIPEPVAYRVWQQRLMEQHKRLEQQLLKPQRK
jgi:hypothetical protein